MYGIHPNVVRVNLLTIFIVVANFFALILPSVSFLENYTSLLFVFPNNWCSTHFKQKLERTKKVSSVRMTDKMFKNLVAKQFSFPVRSKPTFFSFQIKEGDQLTIRDPNYRNVDFTWKGKVIFFFFSFFYCFFLFLFSE